MMEWINRWFGPMRSLLLVAGALALAGCASTLSARVTTFEQWPSGVEGQTWQFATGEGNGLEVQAYQDMVRAAIGATGLVEARDVPGRFVVALDYGAESQPRTVRQPMPDPFLYGGFYGPRYWGWGYGPWGYGPDWVPVEVIAQRNYLTVSIRDRSHADEEVYRSTAVIWSQDEALASVMPYMVSAVFDGFPGNNGQVRTIEYREPR